MPTVFGTPGPDVFRPAPDFEAEITYVGRGGNDTYYLVTRTYFLVIDDQNLGPRTAVTFAREVAGGGFDTAFLINSIPQPAMARNLPHIEKIIVPTRTGNAPPTDWNITTNEINNQITMNAGDDTVRAGGGNDIVQGAGGDDSLFGQAGSDVLFGGAGNDTLAPGLGRDQVHGQAGIDFVSFSDLTINVTVNLVTGTASTGARFTGIEGAIGGKRNDLYFVDSRADQVIEAAGGGTDRVITSTSYALPADSHVETLATRGPTTTARINLTGSDTANALLGNAAANILDGGGGVDRLTGYGGNDTYVVDDALDVVIEAPGKGIDTVRASADYSLPLSSAVENLQTTNATGTTSIDLTGSNQNNTITGNAGANTLKGLGGDDKLFGLSDGVAFPFRGDFLYGGLGNDQLTGGLGRDTFVFDTTLNATSNVDRVLDFSVANDSVQLENAIFSALPGAAPGPRTSSRALTADEFHTSSNSLLAHDDSDRIIYQQTTGGLFYDPDGSGAAGATRFAQLAAGLALTEADFFVV